MGEIGQLTFIRHFGIPKFKCRSVWSGYTVCKFGENRSRK